MRLVVFINRNDKEKIIFNITIEVVVARFFHQLNAGANPFSIYIFISTLINTIIKYPLNKNYGLFFNSYNFKNNKNYIYSSI